jgi:hypothetical protein
MWRLVPTKPHTMIDTWRFDFCLGKLILDQTYTNVCSIRHVFVWLHHRFLPIGHVKILNSFDWTISIRSKFVFIRFCRMFLTTHGRLNSFNQTIFTPNNPLYDHKWVITFATVLKSHIWPQFENLFSACTQRLLATLDEHIFKLKRYSPHPLPQHKTHHFLLYLTLCWL